MNVQSRLIKPLSIIPLISIILLLLGTGFAALCQGGTLTNYTDPNQQLLVPFGDQSQWAQPWRAYLETVPASTFLNGTGINYTNTANPDLVIQHLARHGIARIRLEIGWCNIDYSDETKLDNAISLRPILQACAKYGVRPLILLNANSGVPGPSQLFTRTVAVSAPAGATTLKLTNISGLIIGHSGLSNLTDYWAAEALITAINGNTVTLSKPLPYALAAGTVVPMATLKYRPFSPPNTPDYATTLAAWQRYVVTVGTFVAGCLNSSDPSNAGFDLEVWNELTFGSHFLYINDYYQPALSSDSGSEIWGNLPAATAQTVLANPVLFAGVQIGDGFANTIPWPAASKEPIGVSAISKHPYEGRHTFPDSTWPGSPLNALFQTDSTGFQATYTEWFPEYFFSALQTEFIPRDASPITTSIYGTPHGRYARTPGVSTWITEVNEDPAGDDPNIDAATALYLKGKTTARYFTFYLNKGVTLMTLYNDAGGDRDLGLVSDAFLAYAQQTGATYPADDSTLTSPSLQVTGNISRIMQDGLDSTLTLATTRPLQVQQISDTHGHIQFAGDGTVAHPPLFDRDVLAILPYQVNSSKFVIPYYVMTRDIRHLYDATQTGGRQYDLPAEQFTVTLGGINGAAASVQAYDPLHDTYLPVTFISGTSTSLTVQLTATDSPNLLIVQESSWEAHPTSLGQIRFAPRPGTGYAARMIGGRFQGSKDGVNYVTFYTISGAPPSKTLTTVGVSMDMTAYRYLRYLGPNSSYGDIAEVEFDSGVGARAGKLTGKAFGTLGPLAISANSYVKALDGNINSFFDGPYPNGCYVGIDRGVKAIGGPKPQ